MKKDLITVKDIVDHFHFYCLTSVQSLKRSVSIVDISRPGLELSGYFSEQESSSIILLGNKEIAYINSKNEEELKEAYEYLTSDSVPAIIISNGFICPNLLLEYASRKNVPVLLSDISAAEVTLSLTLYLHERMAPTISMHANLMEICGSGVLITGPSGIGKSEITLELVGRGHRLVADDRVDIVNMGNALIGQSPELTKRIMEVRGIGIIDVTMIFGVSSFKEKQEIDYAIELVPLRDKPEIDRLGNEEQFITILNHDILTTTIPVGEGRNIADMVEVAIRNHLLKKSGINASKNFNEKLNKLLEGK